jgi:hypothetical protein
VESNHRPTDYESDYDAPEGAFIIVRDVIWDHRNLCAVPPFLRLWGCHPWSALRGLEEGIVNQFVNAVRSAVASGNWYAALMLALTMPDICGRLESPENHPRRAASLGTTSSCFDAIRLRSLATTCIHFSPAQIATRFDAPTCIKGSSALKTSAREKCSTESTSLRRGDVASYT